MAKRTNEDEKNRRRNETIDKMLQDGETAIILGSSINPQDGVWKALMALRFDITELQEENRRLKKQNRNLKTKLEELKEQVNDLDEQIVLKTSSI